MQQAAITDKEFNQFRQMIFDVAGISLAPTKKSLVGGRLAKRVQHHGLNSYGDYYRLLCAAGSERELQTAIDLLTTNETYFFREPKHFDFLKQQIVAPGRSSPLRVWSAASSSGEEGYTIAMVLASTLGTKPWEVVGTDISSRVVERARRGQYPMERAQHIPPALLSRYCLKGTGQQSGTLLVARELRERVRFLAANLNAALPDLGQFDFVFLRNVMIYFDLETKRQVIRRILPHVKPGGYLLIGHSESLNEISNDVTLLRPSIYQRPRA